MMAGRKNSGRHIPWANDPEDNENYQHSTYGVGTQFVGNCHRAANNNQNGHSHVFVEPRASTGKRQSEYSKAQGESDRLRGKVICPD